MMRCAVIIVGLVGLVIGTAVWLYHWLGLDDVMESLAYLETPDGDLN